MSGYVSLNSREAVIEALVSVQEGQAKPAIVWISHIFNDPICMIKLHQYLSMVSGLFPQHTFALDFMSPSFDRDKQELPIRVLASLLSAVPNLLKSLTIRNLRLTGDDIGLLALALRCQEKLEQFYFGPCSFDPLLTDDAHVQFTNSFTSLPMLKKLYFDLSRFTLVGENGALEVTKPLAQITTLKDLSIMFHTTPSLQQFFLAPQFSVMSQLKTLTLNAKTIVHSHEGWKISGLSHDSPMPLNQQFKEDMKAAALMVQRHPTLEQLTMRQYESPLFDVLEAHLAPFFRKEISIAPFAFGLRTGQNLNRLDLRRLNSLLSLLELSNKSFDELDHIVSVTGRHEKGKEASPIDAYLWKVFFYTKLNSFQRERLLSWDEKLSHKDRVNLLISAKHDVSVVFYFLVRTPALLSTCGDLEA
jgi:hypothetical protein